MSRFCLLFRPGKGAKRKGTDQCTGKKTLQMRGCLVTGRKKRVQPVGQKWIEETSECQFTLIQNSCDVITFWIQLRLNVDAHRSFTDDVEGGEGNMREHIDLLITKRPQLLHQHVALFVEYGQKVLKDPEVKGRA
jgi:hypothetical protein